MSETPKKEMTLSPSSINTYHRCPRLFYYNYILKIRGPVNIHLYKGNFVHSVLDKLFESSKYLDVHKFMEEAMTTWNPSPKFFQSTDEANLHRLETVKILESFANHIDKKIDMILLEGKVRDENHAWNRIRPKLREHRIKDEALNMVGIIDSVQSDFDEKVYVVDYKTSKLYRETISSEYIRQVSIYAYLYFKAFNKFPDFVGINYLRYGELYFMPVEFIKDQIVASVERDVKTIRDKMAQTTSIEDYPMCNNKWCDCLSLAGENIDELERDTDTGSEEPLPE